VETAVRPTTSALKVIGINAALLLAVVAVTELIFGWWLFGPKFGILHIPRNETRHFDVTGLYPGGGIVRYVRDEYGLRGPYDDPSRIDVLTVGGSTTNERLLAEEATWTGVLRTRLAAAGTPRIVVNAAVEGQSTVGHLRNFELWFPLIPNLRPRFVVAYIGVNDVVLEKAEFYDEMVSRDLMRRVRYFFLNNSAIYHLVRTLRGMQRARDAQLAHGGGFASGLEWVEAPRQPIPDVEAWAYKDRLEAYAQRIRLLAERIRGLGAVPVFATQPRGDHRIRDGRVLIPKIVEPEATLENYVAITLFNRRLMAACRALDAVCIDVAGEIAFGDGDFYDRIHTTPKGSEKIGNHMAQKLRPLL